jgi:hypothetical protein
MKAFKLNYTKANGETNDYLILTPQESFAGGWGGFVAKVYNTGLPNSMRRFNWHRIKRQQGLPALPRTAPFPKV